MIPGTPVKQDERAGDLTPTQVAKLLNLQPLYATAALRAAELPATDVADDKTQATLLLAQVLSRLAFLSELQQIELLRQCAADYLKFLDSPGEAWIIAFTDSHFATWTGLAGYMHLETGQRHDRIPVPPFESLAYNMAESWRRWQNRLRDQTHAKSPVADDGGLAAGV